MLQVWQCRPLCRSLHLFREIVLQLQPTRPRIQPVPHATHHRKSVAFLQNEYKVPGANVNVLTAKQCYHCQGLGHVQADCPTLRLSGGPGPAGTGRCYSCGQLGHLARNCPTPNLGPGPGPPPRAVRGGYGGGFRGGYSVTNNRAATCYKCGGPNHYARDCQAQAMKCYACGKLVRVSIPIPAGASD